MGTTDALAFANGCSERMVGYSSRAQIADATKTNGRVARDPPGPGVSASRVGLQAPGNGSLYTERLGGSDLREHPHPLDFQRRNSVG
jgi:hypothetical protein